MTDVTVPLVDRGNGRWGSPSPAWDHLINRESSGIPDIIQQIQDVNSGGNEAEGLFQITPKTWAANGGREFSPSARSATPQQQAIVAARIFTRNPTGSDWGAGRPGREDPRQLAAGLVPLDASQPPQEAPVTNPRIARLLAVRPDFNEFSNWCQNANGKANWHDRGGVPIDAFLVHTQEAAEDDDNAALDLSNFLISTIGGPNPVSYHDCVRQASDGGVTVVNSVDTDNACWAVGNSNNRSINRCFAGSSANWTRAQWLKQSKAIDVMAYLMVLDAVKYNSNAPTHVTFGPNYDGKPPPVFSDHRYCTKVLRDGNTHVDCGDNFPADVYGASVAKYWAAANATTTPPTPEVPPVTNPKPADEATEVSQVWDQLRLPWPQLGGKSIVDALAQIRDKVCGTNDAGKHF